MTSSKSKPADNVDQDDTEDEESQEQYEWRMGYRAQLQALKSKNQADADKAVLTLSGGALALSITFLHQMIPLARAARIDLLFYSWRFWVASIAFAVTAHFTAVEAMGCAIKKVDDRKRAREDNLGGRWNHATRVLTIASGVSFVFGLIAILWFVSANLGNMEELNVDSGRCSVVCPTATATATATHTPAATAASFSTDTPTPATTPAASSRRSDQAQG